ncbi:MAG: MBL fold metallo-hydrolase [Oscillospiraceae bacterium]|nr:MBL fold metallo-hydrolase [Oscillospiraceae bacterium]
MSFFVLGFVPRWLNQNSWADVVTSTEPQTIESASPSAQPPPPTLRVHFIDVGQGDSILLEMESENMLIDAGKKGEEVTVTNYLKTEEIKELRYVVATHPDSDHIGGLAFGVLSAFEIDEVIMPKLTNENQPNSQTYKRFCEELDALKQNGKKISIARPEQMLNLGDATLRVLGPLTETPKDTNNNSVVLQLKYGDCTMLFMGDAEKKEETALAEQYGDALRCDLLKAGHHGSNTSSNANFLAYAQPKDAVISCGIDNSYNHPGTKAIARLAAQNTTIWRTDVEGNIVFACDGKTIWHEDGA